MKSSKKAGRKNLLEKKNLLSIILNALGIDGRISQY